MDVLVKKSSLDKNGIKYSEMDADESGEKWVLIDNHRTKKNSVLVRFDDLIEFIEQTKGE
jgi:hypothetical protein